MEKLRSLEILGQSIWYDNIQRGMLKNGQVSEMISKGEIKGITSNPSIFQNAIVNSSEYDIQLQTLAWSGIDAEEIFWNMAVDDVQQAADLFIDLYERTNKQDGYVSLEVSPHLAHDAEATINAALSLWKLVDRPNLMVKVPATPEGILAVRRLIRLGINVNVTLIFGIERYREVIESYIAGLEDRIADGNPVNNVTSVASLFVSRIDTKIDALLNKVNLSPDKYNNLAGKSAIFNSRLAYQVFLEECKKPRFEKLSLQGAQLQRPLWASTSTKNPDYRDVMYVEQLIGKNTVNTVPPATLTAFLEHGIVNETINNDLEQIEKHFSSLNSIGISISEVTQSLEDEGVKAFIDAFNNLLAVIENRKMNEVSRVRDLTTVIKERVKLLEQSHFVSRLFRHDPTLWTNSVVEQKEITQRMDWLEAPWNINLVKDQIVGLKEEFLDEGITNALVLGMGGSSLAPEVFSIIQSKQSKDESSGLAVTILDSTHPDEVLVAEKNNPINKTLFIVSSKSGTTGEINAFFQYFYESTRKEMGDKAGSHFIAITDPDTKLAQLAKEKGFRRIITANPMVGGRNSALTAFGIVPAYLAGIDIDQLMQKTHYFGRWFKSQQVAKNPGVLLGAMLGEAAIHGMDKLTILADEEWNAFAAWMEQLIAESSGKNGKGILPIAEEPLLEPKKLHKDRLFVYLRKKGLLDTYVEELNQLKFPVIVQNVNSMPDLAYQFYLWEVATATACSILGVNSFDQPNVQDAKTRTLAGIESYRKTGQFVISPVKVKADRFSIFSNLDIVFTENCTPIKAITEFLSRFQTDNCYLAINAFIPRNEANIKTLNGLRLDIQREFGIATTLGFGPRYLHSTGQFHKGGSNNGIFIILTNTPEVDIQIPGEGISFGNFCLAQALGDDAALIAHGRKTLRIHFSQSAISLT